MLSVTWRLNWCFRKILTGWVKCALGDRPRWQTGRPREPPWALSAVSGAIKYECDPNYRARLGGSPPSLQRQSFPPAAPPGNQRVRVWHLWELLKTSLKGVRLYHSQTGGRNRNWMQKCLKQLGWLTVEWGQAKLSVTTFKVGKTNGTFTLER